MQIALDIDGVLSMHADFFEICIPAWQKAGMKVGILTGRAESDKPHVAEALQKAGITLDFLIFKPQEFVDKNIPNGIWKAVVCRVMKIDILFDDMQHDDPAFVTDFANVVKDTQVFTPINYKEQADGQGNTIVEYVEEIVHALEGKAKE